MAGAAGMGAGLGIMGGILGGIGDIVQSQNYQRPSLPEATGREKRLRDLAQSQLLGAGQQTLGATALYNQLAPILLGQLPGMSIRQAAPPAAGASVEGTTAAAGGGIRSYQDALANFQQAQAAQQRLTELNAQLKGAKKGPEKRAIRQERKTLQRQIKSMPTVAERERQLYVAGMQPGAYTVRMGGGAGGEGGGGGIGAGAGGAPTGESTLGEILGMLDAVRGTGPSMLERYQSGLAGIGG